MSINVIIIAVIALVLMVVLIFLVTGKTRFFGKSIMQCEAKGGTCKAKCDPMTEVSHLGTNCPTDFKEGKPGPACCSAFEPQVEEEEPAAEEAEDEEE